MTYRFVTLDIYSSVHSEYYGRVLTSADSPIDVPAHEAEPWIKGEYVLAHSGTAIDLDEEAQAELQNRLAAVTAEFLKEQRQNESGQVETPDSAGEEIDDDDTWANDGSVGDGGDPVGGSEAADGP